MRHKIYAQEIELKVRELCYKSNVMIRPDVREALEKAFLSEKRSKPREMLGILLENYRIAQKHKLPLCQDTGLAVVFLEIGEEVEIAGGSLNEAVNAGVEKAYTIYNFRKSVVSHPVTRKNYDLNIPAIIHADIVKGKNLKITVMPKGFGSENKGSVSMLSPTATGTDISDFCVNVVRTAGPDACPPYFLGIGIGGTMDSCATLSKKALLRRIDRDSSDKKAFIIEKDVLRKAKALGIGIMGLGGNSTVLGVNVELAPTHIAGCPVAVSLSCHALRSASGRIYPGRK